MIKELREATAAGVLDCKKALEASGGDFEKAKTYLREKGLAAAAKKPDRAAKEGLIDAYIHAGNRVGALIELDCETDFVAKTDDFEELVKNISMHIAAASPEVVQAEDLSPERVEGEREIFHQRAVDSGKPEQVIDKIVDGQIKKFYSEVCLLEQPYVRDTDVTIGEYLNAAIAKIGENIRVRRFARFELGK